MIRSITLFLGLSALLLASHASNAGEMVVALDRVVYPGQSLDAAGTRNLNLRRALPAGLRVVRNHQELTGKVARRTILPNRPIPASALRDAYLVESGKPVRITYKNRGITITLTGIALSSGVAGELVRVRNIDSGKTIVGTVMVDASVQVLVP
jgi:flagella basal body P-ring formation protein FlgA